MSKHKDAAVKKSEDAAVEQDANRNWDIKGSETNADINKGNVHHDFEEGEKTEHQFVRSVDERKNTGRETSHVHAPEVALSPTGGDSAQKANNNWTTQKTITIDNAIAPRDEKKYDLSEHPILALTTGQGMFIPNRQGLTTDQLLTQLNKEIYQLRAFGAQVEKDVDGNDILEMIIVEEKKRNDDGTIQLTGGRPNVNALQQARPKLVHACNFTVHAVVKGYDMGEQEAPEDGVLVIRVSQQLTSGPPFGRVNYQMEGRGMGISSDGLLIFGFQVGGEDEKPSWLNDEETFDEWIVNKAGLADKLYKERAEFVKQCPADLYMYCSYDYPMYILGPRNAKFQVSRGNNQEIKSEDLIVPQDKIDKFKAWCAEMNIEWQEPKWLLCSMYG